MSEQLKHLNLTEHDFDLLVEGLDALPDKGLAGEMMGDFLGAMLTEKGNKDQEKFLSEREKKHRAKEQEKRMLKEDIKILQGKLLTLKRYLISEGALNETLNIINHIK